MAELIVTTLIDEEDSGASVETPGGDGLSLREALALAANGDTVRFQEDLSGIIRLSSDINSEIFISSEVKIYGDQRITLSGDVNGDDTAVNGVTDLERTAASELDDNVRIFALNGGLSDVVLDGLTLTGGRGVNYGGAIDALVSGLTVRNSTFAGNFTEGLFGGGAIYSNARLTIENSSFIGNRAIDGTEGAGHGGGGIFSNSGDLSITNTTFAGNQATGGTASSGGAIFVEANSAPDAGLTVYLNNVTMTGNNATSQGGGLFVDGETPDVIITNSIILGNNANVTVDGFGEEFDGYNATSFNVTSSITSGGNADDVFAETETVNGRIAGVIADNAGPVQTVALNDDPANPALGAGGPNARSTDARQITSFEGRDLGAYQLVRDANLFVTTTDDGIDPNDGEITLREAILAANARDGADVVTFSDDLDAYGAIVLTDGEIVITDEVTIQGNGEIVISGDAGRNDSGGFDGTTDIAATLANDLTYLDDNTRVFSATADVTLDGVTITGGRATGDQENGGGVFVAGADLTILNSTIIGNSTTGVNGYGGGVASTGSLTVINSTISNNQTFEYAALGGGVFGFGDLTIKDSVIDGNITEGDRSFGGGAGSFGELTVTRSTISNNTTNGENADGAGLHAFEALTIADSAIFNNTATGDGASGVGVYGLKTVSATNTTFYGNKNAALDSVGGAINSQGDLVLQNVTVTGNGVANSGNFGGGVYFASDATATIRNSIVTGNSASTGYDIAQSGGVLGGGLTFEGANIVGVDSLNPIGPAYANISYAEAAIILVDGGPQDNAGPVPTISLRTDGTNAAINASGSAATTADARGVAASGIRDLGAYETPGADSFVVTTLDDSLDGVGGLVSLRSAIIAANGNDGADTITFADKLSGVIRLTQGELKITDALTIEGRGRITITGDAAGNDVTEDANSVTDIDASQAAAGDLLADNSRVFNTDDDLTITGLTITGGVSPSNGGRQDEGGGIYAGRSADVKITDSTLAGNYSFDEGGALYIFDGVTTLTDVIVRGNRSYEGGGGVYSDGVLTITDSTFSNNATTGDDGYGGAVYAGDQFTVTGSTFTGNKTAGVDAVGGAIYAEYFTTITSSTFANNETAGEDASGGAIFVDVGANITNSTFVNNRTFGEDAYGGAIYSDGGSIRITHSTFVGNQTVGFAADNSYFAGPAIYANESPLTIENSIIVGNEAPLSGGPEVTAFANSRGDGSITFVGQNIIGVNAAAFDASVSANVQNGDPALIFNGGLSDNGGPVSTIALSGNRTNPALDAASTAIAADARGLVRPVDLSALNNGGTADLGAFELQISEETSPPVFTSNSAISVGETLLSALNFVPVTVSDDRAVTFAIIGGPDAGAVSIDSTTGVLSLNGGANFEEPSDANGDNTFEVIVRATDAGDAFADDTIFLTVTDVNEAPVANAATASGETGATITGALTATDPDGDALTFSITTAPLNGSVTISPSGAFVFTPTAGFVGGDSFAFNVSDGVLSDTATATITVNAVSDPVDPDDPPAPSGPTNGDDTLLGTALDDTISALAGNDNVNGLAGDDLLIGGGGNDSVKGAGGDDRLRGNGGDDTLKGGGGADNLKGGGGDDVIRGNGGADIIRAGGGDDNAKGGGGNDLILGGGGADRLNGGGGADTLRGQGGDDTLKGGGGADVFQFRASDRNDTIADFRQGQDKIQIQSGARSFEALSIEQDGGDVLIGFGAGLVRVKTDNAGAFDESDFIF